MQASLFLVLALAAGDPEPAGTARAGGELSASEQVLLQPAEDPPADVDPTPYRNLFRQRRHKPDDEEKLGTIAHDDIWRRGQWSVSNLTGATFVNFGPFWNTPFGMVLDLVRLNCVWNPPRPNRFVAGSFEGVMELDTMPVVNGPASNVIGGSLLLRYNYRTDNLRRLGIYFQYGGGGMYTDAFLHHSPVLSSGFEFIIQWGLGARLMLDKGWAWNTECNFYHFSNSGMVLPNVSVNQLGVVSGLTYYFHRH